MYHFHVSERDVTERCRLCAARKTGFCGLIDASARRSLAAHKSFSSYPRGSEIAAQGADIDRVGIITSGLVKIAQLTASGDEYVLQILQTGQLVGDPNSSQDGFFWEAATDTTVCWFPRNAWQQFLQEQPQNFQAYASTIATQFADLQRTTAQMRGRSTMQRVAIWLLGQVASGNEGDKPEVFLALTRRDLASLLDMTAETLCRALHQIDKKGAIHIKTPERIEVIDIARLRLLAKCQNDDAHGTHPDSAPVAMKSWKRGAARTDNANVSKDSRERLSAVNGGRR